MTVSYDVMLYKSATCLSKETWVRAPLLILDSVPSETGMMNDTFTKCVFCRISLILAVPLSFAETWAVGVESDVVVALLRNRW